MIPRDFPELLVLIKLRLLEVRGAPLGPFVLSHHHQSNSHSGSGSPPPHHHHHHHHDDAIVTWLCGDWFTHYPCGGTRT